MSPDRDDLATLCAVGVLAAMSAALAHEALGHGGACVISGGEITLLSVIWFGCSRSGAAIELAGPVGGLLGGAGGLLLSAMCPPSAVRARLFGLLLGSWAVFWFSAQMVSQTISGLDDWRVATIWPWALRIAAAAAGIILYWSSVRLVWRLAGRIGRDNSGWRRFLVPHAAGALALVACASLRPNDGSPLETFRAVGLAPIGYLWAVTRPSVAHNDRVVVTRSSLWTVSGLAGLILYGATFGLGMGRMA